MPPPGPTAEVSRPTPTPTTTPPAPTPEPGSPAADLQTTAGNAAVAGLAEDGSFRIDLGRGIQLGADQLEGRRASVTFDEEAPQPVPGLRLRRFTYNRGQSRGTLDADLDVPFVENVRGGLRISVDQEGLPTFSGRFRTQLPVFGNPRLAVSIDEQRNLTGELAIEAADLTPRALRGRLEVTGGGTIRLENGRLSGEVGADLAYTGIGSGRLDLSFDEAGQLAGSGHIVITQPYLQGARADLGVADGNVRADVNIPASSLQPPIQGLQIAEGNIHLAVENTTPSGELEGVRLIYAGLGEVVLDASIERGMFTGGGSFNVTVPQLADVSGRVRYQRGVLTGSATIRARDFPEGLPVRSGQITGNLREDGGVDFAGQVVVSLGPAGSGELRASWIEGQLNIGTTIDLTLPGLQGARFTVDYIDGALEGEGDIPIDTELLHGFSGSVHVEYREGRWAGETEVGFEADNGKLRGTVRVGVRQNEEGAVVIHGGGDVTAQIAPRLEGTLGLLMNEDGSVDVSGAIVVTEPLEMFPEWSDDRELFRISKNIPLWAILVAVIRVRGGVRAGIGPGVFRNIRVEGEYTIGADEATEPMLSISGEMYIPAFVEGYVAFGAGLGVSVVIGSLTGGIEGVATAGLYGAISVVPVLSYENGDYGIEGTATLAAGARLKVGLNAWAEVEALWKTIWERTWELAEWVWNVGPDLALEARMSYTFGNPEPPSIEFSTDDIDSERLIQDALPKSGPAPSGAREALQNRAEWQGAVERPGRDAGTLPADLQSQAQQPTEAPPAPQRPPSRAEGAGGGAPGGAPGTEGQAAPTPEQAGAPGADDAAQQAARDQAAARPTGSESTASPEEVPTSDDPRYPRPVTLATLDEPPAPMPRTRDQQRADLEAAAEVLRLATRQIETTEELAAYFPRIRSRFQLASVGFEEVGGHVLVRLATNPTIDVPIVEKVQGAGIAGWQTEITHTGGKIAGDSTGTTVGTVMEATRLGPDHPQGGPPGSGQDLLMALVVVDPAQVAESKYIRGHLLNDNLGGLGTPINLFPITAQANAQHERAIESRLKEWINDRRYWTYYRVEVQITEVALGGSDPRQNKITASFVCTAAVLDTEGKKVNTISATIHSVFRTIQPAPDVEESNPAFETTHVARQADLDAPVPALSRRHRDRESRLDDRIFSALRDARIAAGWSQIRTALLTIHGLGPVGVSALLHAYGNAIQNGNTDQSPQLTSNERGLLTRVNNLAAEIVTALDSL